MNFRSCKYFLVVCEMGTINAAARKLFISPQSLSQHIRKLEEELDVQLFHRDNPMSLTDAGRLFQKAATDALGAMDRLEQELTVLKGSAAPELTIGMLDYGIPDFIPPLIDKFLRQEPNVLLKTCEIPAGEPVPSDIPLLISARELGGGYKCEELFSDSLVVCVSDRLLKSRYPQDWQERKSRLENGDLHALEGCPFVQHRGTPLETLSEMVFSQNSFTPTFLPVMGTINVLAPFCYSGKAAMITFLGQSKGDRQLPQGYLLHNVPKTIPTGYICYRSDAVLSGVARRFLDITRRYFKRS